MNRMRLRWFSAVALAGAALLVPVASAATPPKKKPPAPKYQLQCQTGVLKGVAWVTGDIKGLANLPEDWTTSDQYFHFKYNCTGGSVAVRRANNGFDVRFAGITPGFGMASSATNQPATGSVTPNPDGSFHVTLAGPDSNGGGAIMIRNDLPFFVLVF